MQSAIGQSLQASRTRSVAVGIACATLAIDLLIVTLSLGQLNRSALALLAFAAMVYVTNGDLPSIGLQLSPRQGWIRWIRLTYLIGLMVGACLAVGFGLWYLSGHTVPIQTSRPERIVPLFWYMCFYAPVLEEAIYRVVVCVALVPVIGCWPTIIVNGFLFGALHVVYGTPSPENLVGGFFLAWAYLKSETILLPLLLHSAGNLLALAGQLAGWHILNQAG